MFEYLRERVVAGRAVVVCSNLWSYICRVARQVVPHLISSHPSAASAGPLHSEWHELTQEYRLSNSLHNASKPPNRDRDRIPCTLLLWARQSCEELTGRVVSVISARQLSIKYVQRADGSIETRKIHGVISSARDMDKLKEDKVIKKTVDEHLNTQSRRRLGVHVPKRSAPSTADMNKLIEQEADRVTDNTVAKRGSRSGKVPDTVCKHTRVTPETRAGARLHVARKAR